MHKQELFIFENDTCPEGYEIEIQPQKKVDNSSKRLKLALAGSTLLKNTEKLTEKKDCIVDRRVIKPKTRKTLKKPFFEKNMSGISRTFTQILNDDGNTLSVDLVLKFTKEYGLLGIGALSSPEPLCKWLKWAQFFYKIYEYTDGNTRESYAIAVTIYNNPPESVFVSPKILAKPDKKSSRLIGKNTSFFHLMPANLLAALYLDLGEQLTYGSNLQKCVNPKCIKWFPIKNNRLHCSNACKTEKSREKKRGASWACN